MIRLAFIFAILGCCMTASAADWVTATIHVSTNAPLGNTNKVTINGDTLTFTNTVTASPATLVQQTNSVTYTATNLLNHLTAYKVNPGFYLSQTSSTNVTVRGLVGGAMVVTIAGGWGHVTYSTQTVSTPTYVVRVPISNEAPTNQTIIANGLVNGIDDFASTLFGTNSPSLANFLTKGASPLQTVISPVSFQQLTNSTNKGTIYGGSYSNGAFADPKTTNLVNYGNAIRSEGSGGNSLQLGSNALSTGTRSLAVGNGAASSATDSLAVGISATASGQSANAIGNAADASAQAATALGQSALASGVNATALGASANAGGRNSTALGNSPVASETNAVAIGVGATASAYNSIAIGDETTQATAIGAIAIGNGADASFQDSIAIGGRESSTSEAVSTTETNQVRLGTSKHTVSVPGVLSAASTTNANLRGTNTINGRVDLVARSNTSLANGYNSGVIVGTNAYVRFSGPSGAYTNSGFASPGGPQFVVMQFDNPGLSFTILDESGLEATAANRILTGTGAPLNSTNRVVLVQSIYDDNASRWRILSFR